MISARLRRVLIILSLYTAWLGCSADAGSCPDAASLQARLDAASAGDTVSIGGCTVTGPLTVPAGVRLEGAGQGSTTITGAAGERAITLTPASGDTATAVAGLTVASDGCAAIVAMGAGRVALEDLSVRATRGVGVAVEGATLATLARVELEGPIDAATADAQPPPLPPFACGSADVATHGLVAVDAGALSLSDVEVQGFGAFGIVAVRSDTTFRDGSVSSGLGTGLAIWAGRASVERVSLTDMRTGAGAVEAYAGAFASGADVTTIGLTVQDNQSFGLFQDGATAVHTDLVARSNGFAAAWAQNTTGFEIDGASMIEDNAFAGVVALGSTGVVLADATIARTIEGVRVSGVRTVRAADGVTLAGTEATLTGLSLDGNDRVGALLDLDGASTSTVTLAGVAVSGAGAELGVVAQNGTLAAGWDSGVSRGGATSSNDAAFTGMLPVADVVGPPCFPPAMDLTRSGIGPLL